MQCLLVEGPFVTPELASQVPPNCYAIAPGLVRPAARGSVALTSADPSSQPAIDMNYLGSPADLEALLIAVDLCREIGEASAFGAYRKKEVMPGRLSRAEQIKWIRRSATTFFHPTGTCKMGRDAEAVVNHDLKVHGLVGLRIADASIMPTITSANTNAPSVMIGEMAADRIAAG